jgi:hypothetical protein
MHDATRTHDDDHDGVDGPIRQSNSDDHHEDPHGSDREVGPYQVVCHKPASTLDDNCTLRKNDDEENS